MAYGLQIFGPDGSLWADSRDMVGGVPLGVYTYSSGGTLSFPELAGATVQALLVGGNTFAGVDDDPLADMGVSINNSPYPVVTIASRSFARTFLLAAF